MAWGGGSFRVSGPASICVMAVGMAQITSTPPQGMDGRTIPNPYGHVFQFPAVGPFQQFAAHN